jgi:hypothetical protein
MENIEQAASTVMEQAIRLLQLVGIPVMGLLFLIGLLVLLTSGKNPRRKRAGFIMSLAFGIGILVVSYVPLLGYEYLSSDRPLEATGNETIESMVDSSTGIGDYLFKGLRYTAIPITFSIFYLGMLIMLLAAKSPQRKRLGLGMMILSPIVMSTVFALPYLLPRL